ncbi:MAG: helix-turn-helix domain-containing protein [Ruminococcus sp.]|nr:helix-turn-helix domain-containing protein [Ruminococcus sp.]
MNYEKTLYNEIGKKIKSMRKKRGMTQENLADITNYSLSFIANIESNTYQAFSISALNNIAKALDTSMKNLLPEENFINKLNSEIICNFCDYKTNLPYELVKLLLTVEEISHKKIKLTCPKCQKKIMF